jgi:plastocyanin
MRDLLSRFNLGSLTFFGALLFLFSAGFPPFDDATEVDLALHMLQHVLIVLAGVMIAYPLLRARLTGRRGNLVAKVALLVSSTLILFWHFPGPWDAAVLNPGVHVVEHLSFLLVGLFAGSFLLELSDSAKIGGLLAAFFGHMGYAVALISPWNARVYSVYSLPDQVVAGWALLLTGPTLVVGIAYVIARNPAWLGGAGPGVNGTKRETFLNRARAPKLLVPLLSLALIVVLAGYFVSVAVAVNTSAPAVVAGTSRVYIIETPVTWQYSPQSIRVVLGVNSSVVWVSHSLSYDTVTDSGGAFGSGPIPPGQTFEFTFVSPGTYSYYCVYHPWMTGTVTVVK